MSITDMDTKLKNSSMKLEMNLGKVDGLIVIYKILYFMCKNLF